MQNFGKFTAGMRIIGAVVLWLHALFVKKEVNCYIGEREIVALKKSKEYILKMKINICI